MRRVLLCVALATTCLASAAQGERLPAEALAQGEVTRLEPLGSWNVDYAEEKCRLSRLFGDPAAPHVMYFEQVAPSPTVTFILAGKDAEFLQSGDDIGIGLQPDRPMRTVMAEEGVYPNLGPAIILPLLEIGEHGKDSTYGAPREALGIDEQSAAKVREIVLVRGKRALAIRTPAFGRAIKALNACTIDLLTRWGLDPEQHRGGWAPAVMKNAQAIARRIQQSFKGPKAGAEVFRMRLIVETDGSVSACNRQNVTQPEVSPSPVCDILRQAEFEPARDLQGRAIRSFWTSIFTAKPT